DKDGAGDQGLMFGYACNQTEELMPVPIAFAHRLINRLTDVRKEGLVNWLRPDSKSQVTVEYEGNRPVRVDAVVISTQHGEKVSQKAIADFVKKEVIGKVIPAEMLDSKTKYHINPTGRFVV
ncbi:MAG: methionine adenosyltransferase, partial [Planctomycetaceae bacterium]